MKCSPQLLIGMMVIAITAAAERPGFATALEFAGSQYDLGGTFFPSGTPPCCIVPWRSDSAANVFAMSDQPPNRYYGQDGYALFATMFLYPDANVGYSSSVNDPIFTANDFYVDILDLPSFITDSEILATRKAGGWAYALIDDPRLQAGVRHWTFDGTNYPPADGTNTTGGIPYVKLGILNGSDLLGNDPGTSPTARWGFEVGEDAPTKFRLGVISDGLDAGHFAAAEIFLTHVVGETPITTISTGQVSRNRFVDIHFFDIENAQAGDRFVISTMRAAADPTFTSGGIAGFTFDVFPEPVGIPGDYNNDGVVDAGDYVRWRNHLGDSDETAIHNNGDGGGITISDYAWWKQHYGSAGSGGGGLAIVPEPATVGVFGCGFAAVISGIAVRRRRFCADRP